MNGLEHGLYAEEFEQISEQEHRALLLVFADLVLEDEGVQLREVLSEQLDPLLVLVVDVGDHLVAENAAVEVDPERGAEVQQLRLQGLALLLDLRKLRVLDVDDPRVLGDAVVGVLLFVKLRVDLPLLAADALLQEEVFVLDFVVDLRFVLQLL